MKLELKHLAGYLPYGLKIYACYNEYVLELEEDCNSEGISVRETIENEHKPILRPLSDLTKEIEVNGEKFVPLTELLRLSNFTVDRMPFEEQCVYLNAYNEILFLNFNDAQKLLEWHFDLFSLIEKGLAIDKNTI